MPDGALIAAAARLKPPPGMLRRLRCARHGIDRNLSSARCDRRSSRWKRILPRSPAASTKPAALSSCAVLDVMAQPKNCARSSIG
jgi:hypothetical protein